MTVKACFSFHSLHTWSCDQSSVYPTLTQQLGGVISANPNNFLPFPVIQKPIKWVKIILKKDSMRNSPPTRQQSVPRRLFFY